MALSSKRAGFTLVELMIAMVAGSFAVAGVYYLSGVSARMFGEQMRVSETQLSLRSAMEQLRRDISRAGYLGAPDSALLSDCSGALGTIGLSGVAPRAVRAVRVTHEGSQTDATVKQLLGRPGVNDTRADLLQLWGNYATTDAYLIDTTASTAQVIAFQTTSESFRRSFFTLDADTGTFTFDTTATGRFATTFAADRMLRVEQNGRFYFRDITAINAAAVPSPTVTLASALPDCFKPDDFTVAAPVMRLRYAVESGAAADLARLRAPTPANGTTAVGAPRTLLVRREETDSTGALVAESSRVVLDYAVEFAVDAVVDTTSGETPTFEYATGSGVTAWDATPRAYRSLIVTLSARSSEADPNLPSLARTRFASPGLLDDPLRTFRVVDPARPTVVLNTRVRTMRSEIFLQNL